MAAKKKKTVVAKKQSYVCTAEWGCGFNVGNKPVWLEDGDSIKLTDAQAAPLIAQGLIHIKEA